MMSGHPKTKRRFRPQVEDVESRCLLSTAVVEVLNRSSYNITFGFRWTPSSTWSYYTERPGQGELFWTSFSNSLTPQVLYNTTTSPSSQTTINLAQGYGQWNGSGTPPASSAIVYDFQNTVTGDQLYFMPPTPAEPATQPGVTYSPVNLPLFGPNGPSYLDVQQGAAGDCWLMASLAEVATRDPWDIRNMFTYDGTTVVNGSVVGLYTVRFFNSAGVATYVNVDTELPSGGHYYDRVGANLWVALTEKAYAEANGEGFVTTQARYSDSYAALNGGDPVWALRAITGKSASDFGVNPSNIAAAWNAGQLIVLCTSSPSSSYIVGNHCYAVVGYNPSSSMPYEGYNPWGTTSSGWAQGTYNGHQVYGLFWADGRFISQNFSSQAIGLGTEAGLDGPGDDAHLGSAVLAGTNSSAQVVGSPLRITVGYVDAGNSAVQAFQGPLVAQSDLPEPDPLRGIYKGSKSA
jgi:hypothetical protein